MMKDSSCSNTAPFGLSSINLSSSSITFVPRMHVSRLRRRVLTCAALFIAALLNATGAFAQEVVPAPEVRPSPLALAQTKLEDGTYIKITYSSPRRRDPRTGQPRQIFGALLPYGEVWRLGANEATELTTTGDILIGGQQLPAGTYSLFAIPNPDTWTIIVNRDLGLWGAYEYNQANDVFRFDVPVVTTSEIYDAFTISFDETGKHLSMMWDRTKAVIPIASL